ncbi:MAG: tRNA (cytidine(34)-2'-O)-methyltransferase [Hyphomicrobiales bacterium]|nr:tRNA (cytidine(34)-2'-O)-methyltransferase [Hyphomicrobiales bacterium]
MVAIALYQPDIPQNAGNILRLGACLDVPVHIILPAGFDISDRSLRRAGMDYLHAVTLVRHTAWPQFTTWLSDEPRRLVLSTTQASVAYTEFSFLPGDVLLFGRESSGVPDAIHEIADARVTIPMRSGMRSLNVASSVSMVLGEALRQTDGFPSAT